MKHHFAILLSSFALTMISGTATGANPILDSLKEHGVQPKALTNAEMSEIKGTALISGQPYPSVTYGLREHNVTYKGWGSYNDYNSYNYIGNSYSPTPSYPNSQPGWFPVTYSGATYAVAGDEWWADTVSSPNSWSRANAQLVEYHYQLLNPNNGFAPSTYALRESVWNRPITKFSW